MSLHKCHVLTEVSCPYVCHPASRGATRAGLAALKQGHAVTVTRPLNAHHLTVCVRFRTVCVRVMVFVHSVPACPSGTAPSRLPLHPSHGRGPEVDAASAEWPRSIMSMEYPDFGLRTWSLTDSPMSLMSLTDSPMWHVARVLLNCLLSAGPLTGLTLRPRMPHDMPLLKPTCDSSPPYEASAPRCNPQRTDGLMFR